VDPVTTHDVNVTGTLKLLVAARDAKVQRVVFSSSSAVYGETPELPKREDMTPTPISPYGMHKLMGEQYCRLFHQLYRVETVCLRYFNVFGPRQDPGSAYAAAIPKFITAILAGRAPVVFGDGGQTRDFTYVENVVEANLAAARAGEGAVGGVFNIACGQRISVNDLIQAIARVVGRDVTPKYDPPRVGDVLHSEADISRAARLLGFRPPVDLASGLSRTIEWFQGQT
jgi:nucleoside-diphosphate-sugar epimerase